MIKEIFIQAKRPHESGTKHVSGYANYTDDISEPEGTLYGAIGWAKKSHAIIKKIDLKKVINKKIKNIRIAYGGMASIPKRAKYCEKILLNSPITEQIINKAQESLKKDFKPISDMRAGRQYRMEVLKICFKSVF